MKRLRRNLKNAYWKKVTTLIRKTVFFDFLESLSAKVQEEFDELPEGDSDKKRFIKALTDIFALLLNTKVDSTDKVKRILKIAVETTLKIWQGQKLQ